MKPLNQIKPNFAGIVLGLSHFKIVSYSSAFHSRWLMLQKIEIASIVHCCFIINQNEQWVDYHIFWVFLWNISFNRFIPIIPLKPLIQIKANSLCLESLWSHKRFYKTIHLFIALFLYSGKPQRRCNGERSGKTKNYKLVFVASPLKTQR